MKAKAEECAYVGDTLSRDVIGAKRMHFGAAIQIRSFLSSQKDEGVDSVWQPDHVVEKIADIVPYLEKLNGRAYGTYFITFDLNLSPFLCGIKP